LSVEIKSHLQAHCQTSEADFSSGCIGLNPDQDWTWARWTPPLM